MKIGLNNIRKFTSAFKCVYQFKYFILNIVHIYINNYSHEETTGTCAAVVASNGCCCNNTL